MGLEIPPLNIKIPPLKRSALSLALCPPSSIPYSRAEDPDFGGFGSVSVRSLSSIRWHYLSNATCLIQYNLLNASFIVSRIIMICHILHHL